MGKYFFPVVLAEHWSLGRDVTPPRPFPGPGTGSPMHQQMAAKFNKWVAVTEPRCFSCRLVLLQRAESSEHIHSLQGSFPVHRSPVGCLRYIEVAENVHSFITVRNPSHIYYVCDGFCQRNSRTYSLCYLPFLKSVIKIYVYLHR